MTREHDAVRRAVTDASLRSVADAIGVSHQTVKDFLDKPDKATDRTWERVRRWMAESGGGSGGEGSGWVEVAKIEAEAARLRAQALLEEAAAAKARARAALAAERSSLVRSTALRPAVALANATAEPAPRKDQARAES
jgi:hypothetical protein